MKQFLLTATLLMFVSSICYGQIDRVRDSEYYPRNEIYIQYGTPSVTELSTMLSEEYRSIGFSGDSRNHKFSGIPAIGYNFFISPKAAIGIDFGFGYASADIYLTGADDFPVTEPLFLYRTLVNNYAAHLSGTYIYWTSGAMECSGAVYVGVNFMDQSIVEINTKEPIPLPEAKDRVRFSYHITAIKFRYGETIGGFAELGFGYRGLVNVGLSIKI